MNKYSVNTIAIVLAGVFALSALFACSSADSDANSSDTDTEHTVFTGENEEKEAISGDEYIDSKQYYKAIHYGDVYTCQIIDRSGGVTKEFELSAEPKIELQNGNEIIKLTYGADDEISKTTSYYYDNVLDRSSGEMTYVLDEFYSESPLVATFEEGSLCIRGMFYVNGERYKEEVSLSKALADTEAPIIKAEFVNATTLDVEYMTADGESFAETVSVAK